MYKTVWLIYNETENTKTEFTYYHFRKAPKFPNWYFEEDNVYTIEMLWNIKLTNTIKIFHKCLFHEYIVK